MNATQTPILTPDQSAQVRRKFRDTSTFNDIELTLIGGWQDLAGFYAGTDGNAYVFQSRFANHGPLAKFAEFRNMRGGLFSAHDWVHYAGPVNPNKPTASEDYGDDYAGYSDPR